VASLLTSEPVINVALSTFSSEPKRN